MHSQLYQYVTLLRCRFTVFMHIDRSYCEDSGNLEVESKGSIKSVIAVVPKNMDSVNNMIKEK